MNNVLDLNWNDLYNEVTKGNITWDEFQDYMIYNTKSTYNEGFRDGIYSESFDLEVNTGIVGEPQ